MRATCSVRITTAIDCLIDWSIYRLIDWLIYWLIVRSFDWLIDWLICLLMDWLTDWLILFSCELILMGDNGSRLELLETSDLLDYCIPNASGLWVVKRWVVFWLQILGRKQKRTYTGQLTVRFSGALLKTCLIFADVVDFHAGQSLSDQLRTKWCGGFEIVTWSNLPQGSGLGTSSILAAAVIAALWSAVGMKFDHESIVHAVSRLNLWHRCTECTWS